MISGDWSHFGRVYMSTPGRGITYGYLPDEDTGIETNLKDSHLTTGYVFDSTISLNYDEEVDFTIYSLSGQIVEKGRGFSLNVGNNFVSGQYIMTLKGAKDYTPLRLIKK